LPVYAVGWCHGAPGIGLSRLRAFELTGDEQYQREARLALRATSRALRDSTLTGFSLCHGILGTRNYYLSELPVSSYVNPGRRSKPKHKSRIIPSASTTDAACSTSKSAQLEASPLRHPHGASRYALPPTDYFDLHQPLPSLWRSLGSVRPRLRPRCNALSLIPWIRGFGRTRFVRATCPKLTNSPAAGPLAASAAGAV
jgi:hypothetical protein